MLNAKEKFNERNELCNNAIEFKSVKRVPSISNVSNWYILDSDLGITAEEAFQNLDTVEKIAREFQERYNFDAAPLPVIYNTKLHKAIKHPGYIVDGNKVNFVDRVLIEDDDLVEYQKNPALYYWSHVGQKFYNDLTYEDGKNAIYAMLEQLDFYNKMQDMMVNEYGMKLIINGNNSFMHPVENFYFTRGLKNFGLDMRRRPEMLLESLDVAAEPALKNIEERLIAPGYEGFVFDTMMPMLIHSIMNKKQFEKFYLPIANKYFDIIMKNNKKGYLFWEAEAIRFAEFFSDIPKGVMTIFPEIEDVRDIRKAFPNFAIIGGMPVDYLGNKSKEECVDYAKDLIDTMGNGYMFSQNKMVTYEYDCSRENLLAVQDFVLNYNV